MPGYVPAGPFPTRGQRCDPLPGSPENVMQSHSPAGAPSGDQRDSGCRPSPVDPAPGDIAIDHDAGLHGYARGLRVLAWALVFLVGVEVLLEARAWLRGYDSLLFARRAPESGAASGTEAASARFGPTAESPFRSRIVEPARPAGAIRVWIASSSLSEAINLPPDRIFAEFLAQDLDERGPAGQVLNAGRAGMTLAASAARLRDEGPRWAPDFVIVYDMLNDINRLSNSYLAALSQGEPLPDAAAGDGTEPGGSLVVRKLQETTTFAQLREQVTGRVGAQRLLFDGLPEAALAAFMRDLDDVCRAARELGAVPVVCTFATQLAPERIQDTPEDIWLPMFRYNMYLSLTGWSATIDELNGRIEAYAKDRGYVLADLAAVTASRTECFTDVAHFSEHGHRLVAPVLAEAVRAAGAPDPAQAVVQP